MLVILKRSGEEIFEDLPIISIETHSTDHCIDHVNDVLTTQISDFALLFCASVHLFHLVAFIALNTAIRVF